MFSLNLSLSLYLKQVNVNKCRLPYLIIDMDTYMHNQISRHGILKQLLPSD